MNLYRFYWDCGRQGSIEGNFLATEEQIENLIGSDLYLGEVLGKHSEVYGIVKESDIKLITDNREFLDMAKSLKICLESGYNPLEYLEEEYYE